MENNIESKVKVKKNKHTDTIIAVASILLITLSILAMNTYK